MVLKNAVAVLTAAASVVVAAPAATASHAFHACFVTAARSWVGDVRHHGVLAGYATVQGDVTLTCRLTVNGTDVGVSGPVSGDTVVATAAPVAFAIRNGDVVHVCADVTDSAGTASYCSEVKLPGVQVVDDTIDPVLNEIWNTWDPDFCFYLQLLAPGIGPLLINSEGDVWLVMPDGTTEPQWDCPPYMMDWGTHPLPAHRYVLVGSVRTV